MKGKTKLAIAGAFNGTFLTHSDLSDLNVKFVVLHEVSDWFLCNPVESHCFEREEVLADIEGATPAELRHLMAQIGIEGDTMQDGVKWERFVRRTADQVL